MCVFNAFRLNSFVCYDFVYSVLNSFQKKIIQFCLDSLFHSLELVIITIDH